MHIEATPFPVGMVYMVYHRGMQSPGAVFDVETFPVVGFCRVYWVEKVMFKDVGSSLQ